MFDIDITRVIRIFIGVLLGLFLGVVAVTAAAAF